MKKRITSLLLTLAMLLSLLPAMGVTASAADDTSYTQAEIWDYESFEAQLRSYESRDLKLMEDINYTVGIDDDSIYVMCNQKLDLNGHKITIDASKRAGFENLLCIRRGEFTLYDSSKGGGGELAVSFPNDDKAYSIIMMSSEKKDEPSKFTMNGGTLTKLHPNMTYTYGASGCIGDDYFNKPENGKRSQITINGGTINCPYAYKWDRSKPLLSLPVEAMPLALQLLYSNLTINGGTFNGIVWTDLLWRGKQDTEPRVVLNGGVFNAPFVVEDMQRTATQMVIDGAHFNDGFHVDDGDNINTDVGTVPQLLLKSGVFDSPDENPKLDIYNATAAHGDSSITKNRVILHAMKCFPNSAIKVNGNFYTSENINSLVRSDDKGYYLKLNSNTPIEVIRDAWGVMESVTLDGKKINYAKDWKGTVENMDNSTAHTIKFTWKPLAAELVNAGYSYRVECDRYISGNKTPTTDTISATANEYSFTIPAGADPKVYSFDLHLNMKKGDNNIGIISNEHIVKLVVNEAPPAPPEPPAPVAHSIKITNGRGTASTTSAFAGDTVTVTAKDDTANNMMFTQWYTYTAGVTFADATQKKTTFVMPDCDVEVNPGFQQVSFRNQPLDTWLSSVDDSKVYFAFSQPITSWKLVNENDQTLDSGDAADANALVEATLVPKPKDTVMTCRVIVTANGQNFTSRTFDLKWYDVPGAPNVKVYPAGGKFVETLDVNLETPNTYWWIAYTTDGSDPYDKSGTDWKLNTSAKIEKDSISVPINKSTTINACLYNPEGVSSMERFGDIVTCDFTKVELTPPVADPPSGTSFYDRLNVSLSTDIVNAKIMWSDKDLDVNDLGYPGKWKEYEPEKESITLSGSYGMHGFYALTGIRMERPDGSTYWVHSDKQDYSYPRITYADMANASVTGKVNEEITPVDVSITLHGDVFAEDLTAGTDVSTWFTNLPHGLKATVKEKTNYTATLVVTISGTPTETSAAAISAKMPKSALRYTGNGTAVEQTVLSNPKAYYSIGTAAAHTHDTGNQSWASLNDYEHYRSCTAGDETNFEPHSITSWTDNGNGTHTGTCTDCSYVKTESHNWQWVVDTHATSTTAGKQHEECPDCHARRSENTEIPATGGGSSSGGGGGGGSSGGGGGGVGVTTYAITVLNSKNGGVTASHKSAAKDTAVTLTVTPDKGYVLDTLTVLDSKDKAVKLTEKNGKYTFTMPSGKVTVSAAFKAAAPASENPFTDVPSGAYYEDAVVWAVKKGITSGTSATTFDPDGSCTRAQAVTFLWRAAGSPEPKSAAMPFTDVPAGSYFEKAVLWAVENGITKGTSDTTFSPDASCTRAQIVTFLWRAGGSPAVSGNSAFSDVASDAYYAAAVAWAEKNGVTGGIGGGLFGSGDTCTRAQIVTFLYRAMK